MAWKSDYITLAQLKSHLRITDTADDTDLAFAITAASRAMDQSANRQFGLTGSAVARYYEYTGEPWAGLHNKDRLSTILNDPLQFRYTIEIDDLMTTTGLVVKVDRDDNGVFEETIASTSFELHPWNAAANSEPWTRIVLDQDVTFPTLSPRSIEVTANWGWSTVPDDIKQATLIQAARFFSRRNAPFGIAGSPDSGSEMRLIDRLDPDVALMVRHRKRLWTWR